MFKNKRSILYSLSLSLLIGTVSQALYIYHQTYLERLGLKTIGLKSKIITLKVIIGTLLNKPEIAIKSLLLFWMAFFLSFGCILCIAWICTKQKKSLNK